MAKMSRGDLKGLVKECLLEILSEGLGGSRQQPARVEQRVERQPTRSGAPSREVVGPGGRFDEAVTRSVKTLTNNPVLQEVLQDTARTTLQQQIAGEPPTAASVGRGHSAPSADLDAEAGNSRWADLAFMPARKKF